MCTLLSNHKYDFGTFFFFGFADQTGTSAGTSGGGTQPPRPQIPQQLRQRQKHLKYLRSEYSYQGLVQQCYTTWYIVSWGTIQYKTIKLFPPSIPELKKEHKEATGPGYARPEERGAGDEAHTVCASLPPSATCAPTTSSPGPGPRSPSLIYPQ